MCAIPALPEGALGGAWAAAGMSQCPGHVPAGHRAVTAEGEGPYSQEA